MGSWDVQYVRTSKLLLFALSDMWLGMWAHITNENCHTRLLLNTLSACSGSAPMGGGGFSNEDMVVSSSGKVFFYKILSKSSTI